MEILQKLKIKVQPLTKQNTDSILDFIVESFKQSPLVKKKIQKIQDLRRNTAILLPKLIQAEQKLNKKRNKNIKYSVSYVQNGKIIAFILNCDLIQFLRITDEIEQDFYFQVLRNHGQQIQQGQDFYSGKIVIDNYYQSKGFLKIIILERFQYFLENGYKYLYGVASNPKIVNFVMTIGGRLGNSMAVTLPDKTVSQLPIIIVDLQKALYIYRKKSENLMARL